MNNRMAATLSLATASLLVSAGFQSKQNFYNQPAKLKINGVGRTGTEGYAQGYVDAEFLDSKNAPIGNPTFYAQLSKVKLNEGENYAICYEAHLVWNKSIIRYIANDELASRMVIVDKAVPIRNNTNSNLDCAR